MITFKIGDHNLYQSQWDWVYNYQMSTGKYTHRPLVPGAKVCGINKLTNMGVITHVGEEVDTMKKDAYNPAERSYVTSVTVLWLTGSKKGQTEIKSTKNLADFSGYRKAVEDHLAELDIIEADAAKTGM